MGGYWPITSGGAWLRNWAGRNGLALRRTQWLRWKLISGSGMFANCATWWSAESIVGTIRKCLLPILFSIRLSRLGGRFDPPWTSPPAHLTKPRSLFRDKKEQKSTRLNSRHYCATRLQFSAFKKKQN